MRLWTAQTFSAFGSRITRTALPVIAVATLGVPEGMMGVMAAAQFAPGVLIAMFAGGFIDRCSKRRILIGADLARVALVASLPIAWWFGALSLLQLALVGAGVGAATALFMITDNAYLPALISKPQLEEGNAKLETTDAIAEIAGPAAAGSLIAALGAPLAVVVDAVSYLWSALWLVQIREPQRRDSAAAIAPATGPNGVAEPLDPQMERTSERSEQDPSPRKPLRPPALADLRFGLRTIFNHPQVKWLVLAHMVWSISGGFFMTLYAMYCLRILHLSTTLLGIVIAFGGIGALLGALLSRGLKRRFGIGPTLVVASTLSLLVAILMPLAATTSHLTMLVLLVTHQVASDGFAVAYVVQAVTLRQTVLPADVLGRCNAAIHVCTNGIVPIAALTAGLLAQLVGITIAVWVGVLVGFIAPLFLLPLWRLRALPTGVAADLR